MRPLDWMKLIRDRRDLDPETKAVAWAIGLRAHPSSLTAFPSVKKLELDTGLSKSTVVRRTRRLELAGWLEIVERREKGHQTSNLHRLITPAILAPGCQGDTLAECQGDTGGVSGGHPGSAPAGCQGDTPKKRELKKGTTPAELLIAAGLSPDAVGAMSSRDRLRRISELSA